MTPPVTTPEPSPTFGIPPTPTSGHETKPGEPGLPQGFIIDPSSASFAEEHRSIADDFQANHLERPFSLEGMDYQPFVDLVRAEISLQDDWIYVTLSLQDSAPQDVSIWYAVEVDLELKGRGRWLIVTDRPSSQEWSFLGVRAFHDANGDVGGAHPMSAEGPPPVGDGYETLVVEDGVGAAPDSAWARRAPGTNAQIQIAVQHGLIGRDDRFFWSVWADAAIRESGWFDYHDHFTLEQAGSPLSNSRHYPLKAMASVDNTCRWAFGFSPTGAEPGICRFELPTPIPSRTPTPTVIPPTP